MKTKDNKSIDRNQNVSTKKQKTEQQIAAEEKHRVEYKNAYVLKGNVLQPFTTDAETTAKITQKKQSQEKKIKSEAELAEIVLNNGKTLFGENAVLINCLTKESVEFSGGFVPDGLLFDLRESEKPKFYFIEVMLSKENLAELFMRITRFFSFFKTKQNSAQFTIILSDAIRKNIGWRNKLKQVLGSKSIDEFLQVLCTKQPSILLVMDAPITELTGFIETYTETWGKYVKPVLIRKFAINGDTVFTMTPSFSEINEKENKRIIKEKLTEEDHLEDISETVKDLFLEIKSELQKVNIDVEFRVKQHYISLRKDKNLAFFQLGKKKLSIVIANPKKDMQKQIIHHETRVLSESVKKFWNGNEHCFTVVVENKEYLEEVISMLKKMIVNEECAKDPAQRVLIKSGESDATAQKEKAEKPRVKSKIKKGKK